MYRGTTPTITFTFEDFDPTTAAKIIVTFSNGLELSGEDLDVSADSISCWLSQAQSLQMPRGNVSVQINFLFADGKRAATEIKTINWDRNLHNEVMT